MTHKYHKRHVRLKTEVIAVEIEGWDVIGDIEINVGRIRHRQQLVTCSQSHHTTTRVHVHYKLIGLMYMCWELILY